LRDRPYAHRTTAVGGGLLAAYLGGGVLSLGSLVGLFTVMGIAARNGILLISHCQHLQREEGEVFGPAMVLRGAREPIVGGLVTSTLLNLFVVPSLYLRFGRSRRPASS
jgi:Cu/Ag efflux pump CusA